MKQGDAFLKGEIVNVVVQRDQVERPLEFGWGIINVGGEDLEMIVDAPIGQVAPGLLDGFFLHVDGDAGYLVVGGNGVTQVNTGTTAYFQQTQWAVCLDD